MKEYAKLDLRILDASPSIKIESSGVKKDYCTGNFGLSKDENKSFGKSEEGVITARKLKIYNEEPEIFTSRISVEDDESMSKCYLETPDKSLTKK